MTDVIVSNKDVVVEVEQPTVPAYAVPPKIGLVEINQVVQRGSAWMTGHGPPTLAGGQYGDMYLDVDTGDMYLWDGAEWQYQGTFAPSTLTPEEILAAMLTVDGPGSGLDADLLDGQHGVYYAKQSDMDTQTTKNDAQDGQIASLQSATSANASNISAESTARQSADTALQTSITTVQTNLTTEITNRTADVDAEEAARIAADNALTTSVNSKIGEAPNDGQQYVRKNLSWQPVSVPPGTIVSDTAPANPPDNQMWFESDTGNLYIWYRDADGAQWVMLAPGLGYTPPDLSGYQVKTAKPGNRFPNPCMQVSQENGTTAVTTNNAYPADQCQLQFSGIACQATKESQQVSRDGNGTYVATCATTAKASLAATDYMRLVFPIEGLDVADLMWGTGNSVPAVLRFNAYAFVTGKYGFSIVNAAGDRSFVGSFDITAFTPTRFEFPIAFPPSGTWAKDNTLGLSFRLSAAAGSNFVGVAGWQTGDKMAPAGCYNVATTTYQNVYITDIGLYADPDNTGKAPAFEPPTYAEALALCRRYYWKGIPGGLDVNFSGYASGAIMAWPILFPTSMRTAPSMALVQGSMILSNCTLPVANQQTVDGYRLLSSTTVAVLNANFTWGSGYVTASARLI